MNDIEIEALKKRIVELEAEIARLRAAPPVQHFHYHYQPPVYAPQPPFNPLYPQVWCHGGSGLTA